MSNVKRSPSNKLIGISCNQTDMSVTPILIKLSSTGFTLKLYISKVILVLEYFHDKLTHLMH